MKFVCDGTAENGIGIVVEHLQDKIKALSVFKRDW